MLIFLIILFVILFILFLPLSFKIHLFYNIEKNRGLILLSIFNIKVLFYKFKFDRLSILLKNKKETKEIKIDLQNQDIDFVEIFQFVLLKQIYLNSVSIYSIFGRKEDAFISAMVAGAISVIFANLKIFILSKKQEAVCNLESLPCYQKDKFSFSLKINFLIIIFDVILSFIIAQIKSIQKRRMKENGKQISSH